MAQDVAPGRADRPGPHRQGGDRMTLASRPRFGPFAYAALPAMLALCLAAPGAFADEGTADEGDYIIVSTSDLVDLCGADPQAASYAAAIHMCHGYLVGVHQLHVAAIAPSETGAFYCLPPSPPSRNEAVAAFVDWAAQNPQAMDLPAIEGLMRWAAASFPCT
jgi:hypothetical protein